MGVSGEFKVMSDTHSIIATATIRLYYSDKIINESDTAANFRRAVPHKLLKRGSGLGMRLVKLYT